MVLHFVIFGTHDDLYSISLIKKLVFLNVTKKFLCF